MSDQQIFTARVIALHGKHSFVKGEDKILYEATRRGRKGDVVVGDIVKCIKSSHNQVTIESIEPRLSLLYRSDELRTKPLASNVDQVAVVFASRPTYNPWFIWKALLAAETADITPLIIRNKTDISEDEELLRPFINELKTLGAHVIELSATAHPQDCQLKLDSLFAHKSTLLIGQSGMGKSTILNLLVQEAQQRTQEYSQALNLGKQTTTSTRWFDYGSDGAIVDSPGFQEFGLAHLSRNDIMRGMPEVCSRVQNCRFVNCRHLEEPGCAIKAAVENGEISRARYDFYKELASQTS